MDYLAKDLRDVQLRWMDLSETSRQLLSDMAGIVRTMDEENTLPDLEPIDVAKDWFPSTTACLPGLGGLNTCLPTPSASVSF